MPQAHVRGSGWGDLGNGEQGSYRVGFCQGKLTAAGIAKLEKIKGLSSQLTYLGAVAVPFKLILEVVQFLPYGNPLRLFIMLLFLTGCRVSEVKKMQWSGKTSYIKGNYLYWQVGKNQGGQTRCEFLPDYFLTELIWYQENHRVYADRLIHINEETARSYFNKFVRPRLSAAWRTPKSNTPPGAILERHLYQLMSIRKTFATLIFANEALKYKGDYFTALHFACKRMCHSSLRITVNHYLNEFDSLEMEKWQGMTPAEILSMAIQRHLSDFDNDTEKRRLQKENNQFRLHDFADGGTWRTENQSEALV